MYFSPHNEHSIAGASIEQNISNQLYISAMERLNLNSVGDMLIEGGREFQREQADGIKESENDEVQSLGMVRFCG